MNMVCGEGAYSTVSFSDDSTVYKNIKYTRANSMNNSDKTRCMRDTSIRELAFLSFLRHPNIVSFINATDTSLYMTYGGIDLKKYYSNCDVNFSEIKHIAKQLLLGLDHIHSKNIIHCDIKPSNCLIDIDTKNVVICDFNLSMYKTNTQTGPATHTLSYRPLECINGFYDIKSDIWALGCTLWELYYKTPLFYNEHMEKTHSNNSVDIIHNIIEKLGSPTDDIIREYKLENYVTRGKKRTLSNNRMPNGLNDIIMSMLNYSMNDRPEAHELLRYPLFADEIITVSLKTKYIMKNHYPLIDSCPVDSIVKTLASNLLTKLIGDFNANEDNIYQWVVLCLISSLTNYKLDFYAMAPIDVSDIDYGVAVQHILKLTSNNIILNEI